MVKVLVSKVLDKNQKVLKLGPADYKKIRQVRSVDRVYGRGSRILLKTAELKKKYFFNVGYSAAIVMKLLLVNAIV
jgi:hypothetical protein